MTLCCNAGINVYCRIITGNINKIVTVHVNSTLHDDAWVVLRGTELQVTNASFGLDNFAMMMMMTMMRRFVERVL